MSFIFRYYTARTDAERAAVIASATVETDMGGLLHVLVTERSDVVLSSIVPYMRVPIVLEAFVKTPEAIDAVAERARTSKVAFSIMGELSRNHRISEHLFSSPITRALVVAAAETQTTSTGHAFWTLTAFCTDDDASETLRGEANLVRIVLHAVNRFHGYMVKVAAVALLAQLSRTDVEAKRVFQSPAFNSTIRAAASTPEKATEFLHPVCTANVTPATTLGMLIECGSTPRPGRYVALVRSCLTHTRT